MEQPWVEEFIKVWQESRLQIAQLVLDAFETSPHTPIKGYRIEDTLQLMDGVFAMMHEHLLQTGNDAWDTYMNTVVPGFLAQGQPLGVLVGSATMNAALLASWLAPKADEKYRDEIIKFVANFYMKINMDIIKVAFEVGATG